MRIIAFFILAFCLSACNTIHNRDNEYVDASNQPDLKIPADVPAAKFNNDYPIPPTQGDKPVTPADLVPPGLIEAENEVSK